MKLMKIWTRALSLLAAAALLATPCLAAERGPFGLTLSLSGQGIAASWRAETAEVQIMQVVSQEQYRESGFDAALSFPAARRDISLGGSGLWRYEAEVSGLAPAAEYVYRVGCEGAWSGENTFTTADPAAETVTFAYFGDIQPNADSEAEYALWGRMAEQLYQAHPELAFAILGGDIVNSGIRAEQFDLFFQNAGPVFSQVPLMAVNGNHESNFIGGKPELYLDYFTLPRNGPEGFTEEFYSFDLGGCHILAVNSWVFSGEQVLTDSDYRRIADWLRADLAASTANWQIVVTHIPVYAVHSDTTAEQVKQVWGPIFEQYGVDLVLEGHQHVYSRSYPLYQGQVDHERGIPYIMGVSGQKFYASADETFAERTIYNTANYQLIRADGDQLTVQTCGGEGDELDFVTLRQRPVTASRGGYVEALWLAAGAPAPGGASPFADAREPWAAWAWETGLIQGYGGGVFGPGDPVTETQLSLIRQRMAG